MAETEQKVCEKYELEEMFNPSFLPKLQEFAKRAKELRLPEKEVKFFNVQLVMQFSPMNTPLTYEGIEEKMSLHIQPITQEDIDNAAKAREEESVE